MALRQTTQIDIWKEETIMNRFQQRLDMLEAMISSLGEYPALSNALSGVHSGLCEDYAEIVPYLLPDVA